MITRTFLRASLKVATAQKGMLLIQGLFAPTRRFDYNLSKTEPIRGTGIQSTTFASQSR